MLKNKTTFALAILIVALVVLGCNSKPEMPSDSAVQTLVKSTISDLADATNAGDFKSLRSKASQDFQSSVSEEKLNTTFKSFVENKEVVVPGLREAAGKDAKFTAPPSIREESGNYILVANGSTPVNGEAFTQVKFNNEYVWRDGAWKLLKVSVNME